MNFSSVKDPSGEYYCVNFNQNATCVCTGTRTGFSLYDLDTVYDCRPTFESRGLVDICIIERNFSMGLVAYVKLSNPRQLVLFNVTKDCVIIDKLFPNTVLSVKLNRNYAVICLEDRIHILDIDHMSDDFTHVITNTPPNGRGLIALSYGPKNTIDSFLAYPASSVNGDVQIFNASTRHAKITIPAHTSQLAALAFDELGEKIATASIKGTLIRVFDVSKGEVLFQFRRGMKRCAEIHCLAFSKEPPDLLCASSNTETIHIFKLCESENIEPVEEESEGWMEMFGRMLTQSAKYLPTQMSDVLTQQRSFAQVHLSFVDQKAVCTIAEINHVPYVFVASLDGFLYIYGINVERGGPCHLVKQHRIPGPPLTYCNDEKYGNSMRSLKDTADRQNALDCKTGSAGCSRVETVDDKEDDVSELCATNGFHDTCDQPLSVLTEIEQNS